MAQQVINYIYDTYGERGVKSFEKRVKTLLRKNGIYKDVITYNAYMSRGNGNGSYYKVAEMEIDGEETVLKSHTNDSMLWDFLENDGKSKRQLFEAVLEENIKKLLD